jgi:hypothetical protein
MFRLSILVRPTWCRPVVTLRWDVLRKCVLCRFIQIHLTFCVGHFSYAVETPACALADERVPVTASSNELAPYFAHG